MLGKNQLGFGQLKVACPWTQEMKKVMSHQSPTIQKKDLGTNDVLEVSI